VGRYEFTTLKVVPGMLEYRGARIQMLDIPGLIEAASEGKGRGKEVLSVIRNADLLLILVAGKGYGKQREIIEKELYKAGFRLNQRPPDVKVTRKSEGGIKTESTKKLDISTETIKEVMKEFRITNGEILIRDKVSLDQLIDILAKNSVYLPALFILNKSDVYRGRGDILTISAAKGEGIENVRKAVWEALGLKRVFLKKPGKEPDINEPYILRGHISVRTIAERIKLMKHFKFAKIWGPTSRFPGQKVGLNQVLQDKDIVEIHD